ncbi:hypothetical protein V8E55_001913 [Tylopilus felleus]
MQPVEDVVEDTVLQLSHFAYKTTSPRPPDPGPSRPATTLVRKDPPGHLPDSQLAQLSKCIGCGLEWTSRKTANQKRTHIKQCAKKLALTEDTIKILVEKEIAILSPTQNTPSSHTETTLLNSVVPVGPLKKSKRTQVLSTLKSLPETRDSILSRARNILGPTITQEDSGATQQFGQSALARRATHHPKRPALLEVNGSMEEPSSTQPFGASSLRAGNIATEQLVDGCQEPPFRQFGASLFAQDSVLTSDRKRKRSASPSPVAMPVRAFGL